MKPVIMDLDQFQIKRRSFYLPGDIVTFHNLDGQMVCHRLLGWVRYRGAGQAITQADNGATNDGLLMLDRIIGRVSLVDGQKLTIPVSSRMMAVGRWFGAVTDAIRKKCVRRLS